MFHQWCERFKTILMVVSDILKISTEMITEHDDKETICDSVVRLSFRESNAHSLSWQKP